MQQAHVLIQARNGSQRLPGKSLASVGGLPLVVLIAKRVSVGRPLPTVVTSHLREDDSIVSACKAFGIPVVRGHATDVRTRLLSHLAHAGDREILVRLTGDNPVPDGVLIDEVIDDLVTRRPLIAWSNGPGSPLPYGVSVEAMLVGSLRQSCSWDSGNAAREHVTLPLHEREPNSFGIRPLLTRDLSSLRLTVDTDDDLETVRRVFGLVEDPVSATWAALCSSALRVEAANQAGGPSLLHIDHFSLGTANLAQPYGTTPLATSLPPETAVRILCRALDVGLSLDTARAYRNEHLFQMAARLYKGSKDLGDRVTTKIAIDQRLSRRAARQRAIHHLRELGLGRVGTILLHNPHEWHDRLDDPVRELLELRRDGLALRVGVSAPSTRWLSRLNGEQRDVLAKVDVIQAPRSGIDWRWTSSQMLEIRQDLVSVQFQYRSIFLQGALLSRNPAEPDQNLQEIRTVAEALDGIAEADRARDRHEVLVAAMRRVIDEEERAGRRSPRVVFGCRGLGDLDHMLKTLASPHTVTLASAYLHERVPRVDAQLLDPAEWTVSSAVTP